MTTVTRAPWDQYFLDGARWVSTRADCRRRQHGAIIVKENRVVATGYNGAPAGKPGCLEGACPRGLLSEDDCAPLSSYDTGPGACIAIHAEANALLHANYEHCVGATIFITGEPCGGCQRLIAGARIARVIWPEGELLPVSPITQR